MPEVGLAVAVRHARAGDGRAVTALLRGIYGEGRWFVGDGPQHAETLARRIDVDDPAYALYLVACSEGETSAAVPGVLGWLELHRLRPRTMRHVALLTLAVAPQARRRGVGRSLLRTSYGWAADVGIEKISLNVRAGNDAAIGLYRSEGFELEGRERRQVRTGDAYEDNLIMARFVVGPVDGRVERTGR